MQMPSASADAKCKDQLIYLITGQLRYYRSVNLPYYKKYRLKMARVIIEKARVISSYFAPKMGNGRHLCFFWPASFRPGFTCLVSDVFDDLGDILRISL